MRKKQSNATPSASSTSAEINRKINALVMLLEERGVIEPGEFDDAVMNLKIQLADQMPKNGKPQKPVKPAAKPVKGGKPQPQGRTKGKGNEYVGPERRNPQTVTPARPGQDRRSPAKVPTGHISGTITRSSTHQSISGVQLILRRSMNGSMAPTQFRSTKSDLQGRFVFLNLPLHKDSDPTRPIAMIWKCAIAIRPCTARPICCWWPIRRCCTI